MIYNKFAYYYDIMMENINYDYFKNVVLKYIKKDAFILDAGCGTGAVMLALLKENYNVVGIDISSEMLEVCENKLAKAGFHVPLYENNLTEEFAEDFFDCVISFFDVMNYIKEYKKAFQNIYLSLKKGGIFIFDIHSIDYINNIVGYSEKNDYGSFRYSWNVEKGDSVHSIIHNLEIVTKENKYYEKHYQETKSIDVYIDCLNELGFITEILDESDENKIFIKCIKIK